MAFPRRLPRRRRTRLLLLAVFAAVGALAVAWSRQQTPVAEAPPAPLASAAADAAAQDRAGSTSPSAGGVPRHSVANATAVPDIPAAWQRIASQASGWPSPDAAPVLGTAVDLPTVPASRMRDTIGMNVDLWRTEDAWRDFDAILRKIRQLRLRHARVGMQSGATLGLARMQELGRAGVRLDVVMGDAYGRFGTAPYSALEERLRGSVAPYVDAVEGTNEADLTRRSDWVDTARSHQRKIVRTVAGERGDPIGVIAPSVGRQQNGVALGDLADLADAANAHAYSSGGEPGEAIGRWIDAMQPELPGGPVLITEAGFQTDVGQTKYHTPTSPEAAGAYVPRTILEAIRRGVPQVYLYELVDRWSDPFGIDTAAHFGMLEHDLTPKPAWDSLVRLQRALLDNGRPDVAVPPVQATVEAGPDDLRVVALRKRDGSIALAVWRAVSVWDAQGRVDLRPTPAPVRIRLSADTSGALVTDVVSGARKRLGAGETVDLEVAGAPVVVTGLRPTG